MHANDGTLVGTLHRIVVDKESWDPHALVVEETARFNGHRLAPGAGLITNDIIVPLDAVSSMSHDRIDLGLNTTQVRHLPPYLHYQFEPRLPPMPGGKAAQTVLVATGAVRWQPLLETADKPPQDIEIRPGENVMLGHEGHKLGHVRDVLFDEGELVGIVVHPTGFFHHDVVVQVRFLERSDDLALFVRMSVDELRRLLESPSPHQ